MALQTSGQISINDIRNEIGTTSGNLRTLSSTAGFSTPDGINEFYGYSAITWFSAQISETGFESSEQACSDGPNYGTTTVYYASNTGFTDLRTSAAGEPFDGRSLWYYVPDAAGSYVIDSQGRVGEFISCK